MALKRRSKTAKSTTSTFHLPNLQKCPEIDSFLPGGALGVLGVHLQIFKITPIFFSGLRGAGAPTAPPGYAYVTRLISPPSIVGIELEVISTHPADDAIKTT